MSDKNMELGESELPAIREFLDTNPEAPRMLARMSDGRYLVSELEKYNIEGDEAASKILLTRISKAKSRKLRRRRILYVASTAAVVLVAAAIWRFTDSKSAIISPFTPTQLATPTLIIDDDRQFDLMAVNEIAPSIAVDQDGLHHMSDNIPDIKKNRIVVPQRYHYNVTLEDGTKVSLNANSELSYPSTFTSGDREVTLRGEGWFEVSPDPARRFVIHVGDLSVNVYGTAFNINSNKSGHIDVLLVSGSLGVTIPEQDERMLKPNELLRYDTNSGTADVEEVDPDSYIAWRNGFFLTNLQELGELMDDISSWYGVSFVYRNANILKTRVSVMIDRGMDIDALLETLQLATGIKIIKEKDGVYEVK